MDPPFSGFVLDPSKCCNLSIEEKRELIRELSKWPESAPEKLQAWSRRDLIELLCAEMGKERKCTGLTKQKLIEYLFRIVSEKKAGDSNPLPPPPPPAPSLQPPSKRQRKNDHPSRLPVNDSIEAQKSVRYCLNLACRATLSQEDAFCKRCSCCICHKYDDNKDPSLWLVCSSDAPSEGDPCGLSCHLECALRHERAGISKNGKCTRLDGSYYCICCGKVNNLLRCWRKQLMTAKEARRVDVLCYRLSLSHKLLILTDKYQCLHEIVDTAMKKLESEVGPLNGFPNMARGIVNRLSVGAEVQRLCARAVESLDSMLSSALPSDAQIQKANPISSSFIKFEGMSPSHAVVLYSEDHRSLPQEPAGYTFKEVAKNSVAEGTSSKLCCERPKTNSGGQSNPSSEGDESNNISAFGDLNKSPDGFFDYRGAPEILDSEKLSDNSHRGMSGSRNACIGMTSTTEATEKEETPRHSDSAVDEEPNSTIQTESQRDSENSTEQTQASTVPKSEDESNIPPENEMVIVPYGISGPPKPVSPCWLETGKDGSGRSVRAKPDCDLIENSLTKPVREPGSSSKKRGGPDCEEVCGKDGSSEGAYEYCVKVIRWLECEGHIETNFRVKFLTWFSLRASPQERRVVSVYVDTLIDDPTSLAGQLVDTFTEAVSSKRPPPMPTGFCMRLWH